MKIAILGTRGLPPRYGGFETLADRLSGGLVRLGHEVIVYGRTGHGQEREALIGGVRAVRVPAVNVRGLETLSAGLSAAVHAIGVERPDIALVCNPGNVWAALLLRRFGIPVLLHVDGLEHQRAKWQGVGARVHSRALATAVRSRLPLVADSHAIVRWYAEHHGRTLAMIPYGADRQMSDEAALHRMGLSTGGYDLVVARWEPENQILEIVRAHALAGISQPLVVIGAPAHMTSYARHVLHAISAHPNAMSVGQIWDQDELRAIYAGARCYLHGHSVGGTNPTLLAGAVSGAEVLAHDNAFNREVAGPHSWLWSDGEQLRDLLMRAPWTQTPMVELLRTSVLARYQWDAVIADYEALFHSVRSASI